MANKFQIATKKSALIAMIADEDAIIGFLLAGVCNVDLRRKTNYRIVDSSFMASQQERVRSSADSLGKKKYGKNIKWTPELSFAFIKYVAEEVRKGNKRNNTLEKEAWKSVMERFLKENGITVTYDQLRNHFDKTRRTWQGWRYLGNQTGLGWDPVRHTYTASDTFWEGFKKMYKEGGQFKWKGLSSEEEQHMRTIYEGNVATGEDRWNPFVGIVPPNEDKLEVDPVEPFNIDNSNPNMDQTTSPTMEGLNPPIIEEMTPQSTPRSHTPTPSSSCQPPTCKRRRSERCSSESSMNMTCDILEEMERVMAPESNEKAQLASFEKCMQLLEGLPSFDTSDPMYAWAPSFLCKKVNRLMFISMTNCQLREAWLRREFDNSNGKCG